VDTQNSHFGERLVDVRTPEALGELSRKETGEGFVPRDIRPGFIHERMEEGSHPVDARVFDAAPLSEDAGKSGIQMSVLGATCALVVVESSPEKKPRSRLM
jgi:hypothetical protein